MAFKMTTTDLKASADRYSQGANDVRTILGDLGRTQEDIRTNWEGDAFASFDAQFIELSDKVGKFSELLDEIKRQLYSVADAVDETEANIKQNMGFK